MGKTKVILVVLISICLIGILAWKSYGNNEPKQSAKQKWKYRAVSLKFRQRPELYDESILNRAGEDGWELVGITSETRPVDRGETSQFHVFYFKRPL